MPCPVYSFEYQNILTFLFYLVIFFSEVTAVRQSEKQQAAVKKGIIHEHSQKIYCRAFQKAFHIAIPFLPYRKPKIAGSVRELPEIIMRHKCTHVLIITDGGIMTLGLTRRLEKALKEAGIPYTIYDKTVANPTTVNVREALELYHKEGCDAIIGFGGGSSMDCAKAVGACAVKPNQSLAQMKGILKVHKNILLSCKAFFIKISKYRNLQTFNSYLISILYKEIMYYDRNRN